MKDSKEMVKVEPTESRQKEITQSTKMAIFSIRSMSRITKYILVSGISLLIIGLSVGGGYWRGYSTYWDEGVNVGYLDGYNQGYRAGVYAGKIGGKTDGWNDGYQTGVSQGEINAKNYIIDHTKGRIKWTSQ
jgi:hypothetical protein